MNFEDGATHNRALLAVPPGGELLPAMDDRR
jgi:hypothetical protein